jgi:hypothetical protein
LIVWGRSAEETTAVAVSMAYIKHSNNKTFIITLHNKNYPPHLLTFFLLCIVARNMPYPYSALSSNNELPQAGPYPSGFTAYGHHGAEPPQMDEHPVAFATIIRSPNNCRRTKNRNNHKN